MNGHCILWDDGWVLRYVPQLESFYNDNIVRKVDFDERFSDISKPDNDEAPFDPYE